MKKLFISVVEKDRTQEEIEKEKEELKQIAVSIVGNDLEVIKTVPKEYNYNGLRGLQPLANGVSILDTADIVIFGAGWMKDNELLIEHYICERYNIPIIEFRIYISE